MISVVRLGKFRAKYSKIYILKIGSLRGFVLADENLIFLASLNDFNWLQLCGI